VNLDGFALPVKKLQGTDPVETLDLSGKKLGVASAVVIASLICANGGLMSLDLSHNDLCNTFGGTYTAEGITAIADALGALTSVELRGNELGDEGWGAIFAAICGNKDSKIMSMDASSERIGPAGSKLIAEALRTSVTGALASVDLSGNHLTDYGRDMTGIKELAAALGVNGGLTKIDLRHNDLEEEGEASIRNAVQGKAGFQLELQL